MFSSNTSQVSSDAVFVEDIFSTTLYTGNGSTQTITNGIDLSTYGGMVWSKSRSTADPAGIFDTVRGATNSLRPSGTTANLALSGVTSFDTTGFTLGSYPYFNGSGQNQVAWTFREQAKFFDVVTYTGNGASVQNISHSLGSTPGCILIKRTDTTENWCVFHRGTGSGNAWTAMSLNSTSAGSQGTPQSTVTSTTFDPANIWGAGSSPVAANTNGGTFVAYLFAHDAGGFGLTGTDNVISCGSFTASGTASITLGWEPQFVMIKPSSAAGAWRMFDSLRGMFAPTSDNKNLLANAADAETNASNDYVSPTSTGFVNKVNDGATYIYIAIRRGPMKVPTDATKVFNPVLGLTTAPAFVSSNFNSGIDSAINFYKPGYPGYARWSSRLTGTGVIPTSSNAAESAVSVNTFDYMNGFYNLTGLGSDFGAWMFKRAPGFHDQVCYTGNRASGASTTQTVTHNLGVAPELLIVKGRSNSDGWQVYLSALGASNQLALSSSAGSFSAANPNGMWNETAPTATQFTVGANNNVNRLSTTYVAYLFATCAGVSKVGSYTGTGATQTISCGFTGGARFVLIKRTDNTGNWFVWDTARGMVAGTDPYLEINQTNPETNANWVYTTTGGFQIVTSDANVNANGGTYIFLAIA